jgi:hypothetical protein
MPIILHVNNGCSNDENDMENDSITIYNEYTHSEIINRCDFGQIHLIQARLLSITSSLIQHQETNSTENNVRKLTMVAGFSYFENDAANAYPKPLHDVANIITCVIQVS